LVQAGCAVGRRADRGRWTLVAVCATTFMLLVDITIVNVALPSVQRELHASLTGLQWVVDAYAVSLAALILTAGALADRFGRKRVFELGIVLFTVASLLCGVAWNVAALDTARALQGIGGAALFATALALIGAEFQGPARGTAIAVWGATDAVLGERLRSFFQVVVRSEELDPPNDKPERMELVLVNARLDRAPELLGRG
jgi:MFS family permease